MEENNVNEETLDENLSVNMQEFSEEEKETYDLAKYIENVQGVSAQTRQDLTDLMELLAQVPGVAAYTAKKIGRDAVDSIDSSIQSAKQTFRKEINQIKKNIEKEVVDFSKNVQDYAERVYDDQDEIEMDTEEADIEIEELANEKNKLDEKWSEEKKTEGRSDKVVDAVQNVKKASRDVRGYMASGAVKVVGTIGKGLALFGKKNLAKSMLEKTSNRGKKFVSKESRIGKIMQKGAEFGFKIGDGVRETKENIVELYGDAKEFAQDKVETASIYGMYAKDAIKNAPGKAKEFVQDKVETAGIYGMYAKDAVQENVSKAATAVKEGTIKSLITLGKSTEKVVGTTLGIAEFGIEAVVKGAKSVNSNVIQPTIQKGQDFKENKIDPTVEKVGEKAIQTGKFGMKFWDLAKAKVNQVRNAPTNLKARTSRILSSMAEKIAPTLSQELEANGRTELATQKSAEAREAFNTLTGKNGAQEKSDDEGR